MRMVGGRVAATETDDERLLEAELREGRVGREVNFASEEAY